MTEKQTGRINAQLLTKCINHWADSANFKGVTFNKLCSGLTVKCFEMPNASYTNRYAQGVKTTVVIFTFVLTDKITVHNDNRTITYRHASRQQKKKI
jgi:hypothetical protein